MRTDGRDRLRTLEQSDLKVKVRDHWESGVCGSHVAGREGGDLAYFASLDAYRYSHEPMIRNFARFDESRGLKVLEVGLGSGCDFVRWVRSGAVACGRDLTEASVAVVKERLALEGLQADVARGDAEHLDLAGDTFDIYYSWGVLHHTPDTSAAIGEAARVLKPGGVLRIMLYHYPSVGCMLTWLAFGPLSLNFKGPRRVVADHVESPGTQCFTRREAAKLVRRHFGEVDVDIHTYLWDLDLLTQELPTRFAGRGARLARAAYPRALVRQVLGDRFGTVMTIEARKPVEARKP